MKKGIKIILWVVVAILAAIILIPVLFRGKIEKIVKREVGAMVDARFDFERIGISLIRAFPNASLAIRNISIVGNEPFAGDTLLYAADIRVAVNLLSLFGDSGFTVTDVMLNHPRINAIIDSTGVVNWDILKEEEPEAAAETPETEQGSSAFELNIDKVRIRDGRVSYTDRQTGGTRASIDRIDATLSGNMSASHTLLKADTRLSGIDLSTGGSSWLNGIDLTLKADVDADLKNNKFVFADNTLSINAISASVDGWIAMPEGGDTEMDLKLNTSRINFKELLSLIPAMYSKNFADLQAEGEMTLSAWAKGVMNENELPEFAVDLQVKEGKFRYPSLPSSVDDIQISANIASIGGDPDLVTAKLECLHFRIKENSFSLSASGSSLRSDPKFSATAFGTIDLASIAEVYPLDEQISMEGIVKADVSLSGTMSQIEREQYENLSAEGKIEITGLHLNLPGWKPVVVHNTLFRFTPRCVELKDFSATMGGSDLKMEGELTDFIPYVLKGKTVKGVLSVSSDRIDLADLTSDGGAGETGPSDNGEDTTSTGTLTIPSDIDFALDLALNRIDIGTTTLSNVRGAARMAAGKMQLNGLRFNAFDGTITASGMYDSSVSEKPGAEMTFAVANASFGETFSSLGSLSKLAPIFENMTGDYSMDLSLSTQLTSELAPELSTLNASGSLRSNNVSISNVKAIDMLADAISYPALKSIRPDNLNLSFSITDGKIHVSPFTFNAGGARITLGGSAGLDQTIDYEGNIALAQGVEIMGLTVKNIPFTVTGSFTAPEIGLDAKSLAASVAKENLEGSVVKIVDQLGIPVPVTSNTDNSALTAARALADEIIEQADIQADKLIQEAGNNTLKKIAARAAAEKLRNEARKRADEIIAKASAE